MQRRRVITLSERLSYWTEPHPDWRPNPEWPEDVGCVLYLGPDAVVLIDPLVRDDLDPTAWDWLDAAVSRARRPVAVLLTAPWHERSARDVVERYGGRIWVDPSAGQRIGDLPRLHAVPRGIEVFTPHGVNEGQVAFFIPSERALVVAEFFVGTSGGLRVCPSPATYDTQQFAQSLRKLAQLPIECVLVAHGPPVLRAGCDAIAAALDAFTAASR